MEPNDGELAIRAAAGDDSAFSELAARYRSRIYHLALSVKLLWILRRMRSYRLIYRFAASGNRRNSARG